MSKLGLVFIVVSFSIFSLGDWIGTKEPMCVFFANYIISVAYLLGLLFHNFSKYRWAISKGKLQHTILLLVLWFISAFSLNLEMNVFQTSTNWLSICLVIACTSLLTASIFTSFNSTILRNIIFVCLGFALVIFSYYAIYLLPLYLVSLIGILALGIALHTFVPLFLIIATLVLMRRAVRQFRALWYPILIGCTIPIVVSALFLAVWYKTDKKINQLANKHTLTESKLPKWVSVAQHVEANFITDRIFKAGLIYYAADRDQIGWNNFSRLSFDEPLQHDPLVVLATFCFNKTNLNDDEKIKILKSMHNARHQAAERLWSGDHLSTTNIVSHVKLFPAYRMAYTEQTITIRNDARSRWSDQEAIYTFQLNEGAVVSSLSLWIDGKEEKSRLTTKAKADSAYQTIVGVEVRDPSVVHWQEGNTISLRVFPCTPKENRQFKIGITSPLLKKGNRLTYQSPHFEGPISANALHTIQLSCEGSMTGIQVPPSFNEIGTNVFTAEVTGQAPWEMSCSAPNLANKTFSFDSASYQLVDYQKNYISFNPKEIYLDINATWTRAEFDQIWETVHDSKVFVDQDGLKSISDSNKDAIFNSLSEQQFSVFPLQKIKQPQQAMLITKSSAASPNLNDLTASGFSDELSKYLQTPKKIYTFHLGKMESPYLKALKELRVLHCEEGKTEDLLKLLQTKQFLKYEENEQQVVIENAQMVIKKTENQPAQDAPDHLLRLFAYNDIMKKVGVDYFNNKYIQPALIAEAETAFIVSPVSSLIVLEMQKDYDRFDIEANKNSLKNASMHSSGAVPEPHEWALMALVLAVVAFLSIRNKKSIRSAC